jgi:hypothetical protein
LRTTQSKDLQLPLLFLVICCCSRLIITPQKRIVPLMPLLQCGLNVFPVSIRVFNRERIRAQPSAVAA